MCKPRSEGGDRCKGSLTGSALYALYKDRKAAEPDSAELLAIQSKIDLLKKAESRYGRCVTPYELELSPGVESVIDAVKGIGNPLVVGGCVRDSFLGAENKDIDIEVHGTNIDTLVSTLKSKGFTVDEVGKQFGVLKVSKKGVVSDIDISVPRKENNVGAGHRGFEVSMHENMTVEEAAARRDFTFNSVMYDHEAKALVDPYRGAEDFNNKKLRHVSEAFSEDPLRVLRAFQFSGRFDLSVDNGTANLCKSLRSQYGTLSTERVVEEWGKFYEKSKHPSSGVKALQEMGWDDTFPGLRGSLAQKDTAAALSKLPEQRKEDRVVLGAASVARNMDSAHRDNFIEGTVLGVKQQNLAKTLVEFEPHAVHGTYEAKKFARDLKTSGFTFEKYEAYAQMHGDKNGLASVEKAKKAGVFTAPEAPLLMGRDVIGLTKQKPGPWMGEILGKIEDMQYRGKIRSKDEALLEAKRLLP